ncbi:MAG: hypothetical protein EAY66_05700 [Sphingobacteriales bacterium]|jgi:hypothetical protein|nr:MAG: hypothetical protein EAY66_05700 [Sphingobacteriales bacterium]
MIHILSILLFLLHPFYVSVTDIKHNQKSKTLEISSKIFSDDLEKAIFNDSKVKLDIAQPSDKAQASNLVALYLKKHLSISVNDRVIALKSVGYEVIDDAVWCYLETEKVNSVKKIDIKNDILLALHPQQINIMNLKIGINEAHFKLDLQQITYTYTAP